MILLPYAKALGSKELAGSVAMRFSRSPCPSQNALLCSSCDSGLAVLSLRRPCGTAPSLGSSPLSERQRSHISSSIDGPRVPCSCQVSWSLVSGVYENTRRQRSIGTLQTCLASTQSPKQSEAAKGRSFWASFLRRTPIYSSNFSDVDPIQLSELWLQTLRVRRDPEKIVKALRHSFAFVIVLVEDENAPPTTGSRLKTVGVGRAVSDGTFIATICDVAVDPAYRHRGIGRRIVKKLVENMKKIGGPSGFAVFPPPVARRFFWMIGFRSDRKYKLMAYREKADDKITVADATTGSEIEGRLAKTE